MKNFLPNPKDASTNVPKTAQAKHQQEAMPLPQQRSKTLEGSISLDTGSQKVCDTSTSFLQVTQAAF